MWMTLELITDQEIMLIYLVQLAIGTLVWNIFLFISNSNFLQCYQLILRYNRNEIKTLKKGAQIESYSVSRSFQLHENLTIMRVWLFNLLRFFSIFKNLDVYESRFTCCSIDNALFYSVWIILKVSSESRSRYYQICGHRTLRCMDFCVCVISKFTYNNLFSYFSSFLTIVINAIRFEPKFRDSFLTLPFAVRFRNKVGTLHVMERWAQKS